MASASPPPSLTLTVEKGPKEGEWVEAKNSIRIGRVVRGNSLAIKEDGISSKHLLIQLDHLGRAWVLQDLNSSNGTILNASPVPPNAPVHLAHGDTIKIGAYTVLKVHIGPQQAGGASSHSHPIPRNSTRQARGGPNKKAMADGGCGGGGRTTRGARVDGRNGGGDAGVTCEVVESVETRAVGGGGRTTRSSARVDGGASTKAVEAPAAVERRGGRNIKAMADRGGGGGRTTRDGVDGRNGGGDAGVTSKVAESVETQGVGGGGRTTRSRARVNGGASTKVLEAPAAVERRGGRKTRGRGGDGDSVGVSAGAEIVLEAPKQRKGRPPRRAGTSKTALEVEKVEEEEQEHVSTVSGAAEGIEQMVSNLGSKDEGGCEETGDLVPTETVAAASGRKGNLDGVPNLDMPLGEWLDYVERQLLQQIDEETELIIEGMKLKAKRVAEYVASCGEQLHQSDK